MLVVTSYFKISLAYVPLATRPPMTIPARLDLGLSTPTVVSQADSPSHGITMDIEQHHMPDATIITMAVSSQHVDMPASAVETSE